MPAVVTLCPLIAHVVGRGTETPFEVVGAPWISDPKGKAKSVWLNDEGPRLSEELFQKYFALASSV